MKNILLFAFALSLGIKNHAQSSTTNPMHIGDNGLVYVSPGTLLYSKGGLKATAKGKLESQGNVKLDNKLENGGDGSNIIFNYKAGGEDTAYGQLQISQGTTGSTNKITMMTNALEIQGDTEIFPAISFPFTKGTDLINALENSSIKQKVQGHIEAKDLTKVYTLSAFNDYRSFNYAWYLDNDGHEIKNAEKELLEPYLSYTLNLYKDKSRNKFSDINKKNFKISGAPFFGNISVELKPSLNKIDFTTDEGKKSIYYIKAPFANLPERYVDQISDFIVPNTDKKWGHNLYELGNPYTQNIDLFEVLNASGLTPTMVDGIAIMGLLNPGTESKAADQLYENYNVDYNKITCTGSSFSSANCITTNSSLSSSSSALVRPFGTFNLKLSDSSFPSTDPKTRTIVFDDRCKTFNYKNLFIYDPAKKEAGTQQSRSARQAPIKAIEQLTLSLKENDVIKGRVALGANPWAVDVVDKQLDAVAGDGKSEDISLYLLNEKDNLKGTKLSINGFNMSTYRGKPLQIGLKTIAGQNYTLGGSVSIAEKNALPYTHFFIEDKQENKIMRVGAEFSYSFSASNNDSNRFVAYYDKVPVDVDKKQVEENLKSRIDIARNSDGENVIVFKGQTGKARIYVYNILGQLIFSDKNVNTSSNYSLNRIPHEGVYLVKVISSKGKIITKKIIK